MEFISNKYLTTVKEGSFNKPSTMDKKLVALSAIVNKQVLQLRDDRFKFIYQLLEKIFERKAG